MLLQDLNRRRLELVGIQATPTEETLTPSTIKQILSVRWQLPKNNLDEVQNKIFIGKSEAAKDIDLLSRLGITHIVNTASSEVRLSQIYYTSRGHPCTLCNLPIEDDPSFRICDYFEEASRFIDLCVRCPNSKVLVHSDRGVSRAPAIVIAYMMIKRELDIMDAIKCLRAKRGVLPNEGFLKQLIELDKKIKSKMYQRSCSGRFGIPPGHFTKES